MCSVESGSAGVLAEPVITMSIRHAPPTRQGIASRYGRRTTRQALTVSASPDPTSQPRAVPTLCRPTLRWQIPRTLPYSDHGDRLLAAIETLTGVTVGASGRPPVFWPAPAVRSQSKNHSAKTISWSQMRRNALAKRSLRLSNAQARSLLIGRSWRRCCRGASASSSIRR